jgi:hypothetical protein
MTTLPDDWTDEVQAYADSMSHWLMAFGGTRRICVDAFAYTVIKLRDEGLTEGPISRVCTPLLSMNTETDEEVWRVVRGILVIAKTVKAEQIAKTQGTNTATIEASMHRYAGQLTAADA